MELPSIAEFYRNRCVLVTGGTGFMGKVLVEKLLRSCPDIETIYLLARAKSGAKIQDRIQEVIGTQIFDNLRQNQPEVFGKLKAIAGDVTLPELGISAEDLQLLQEKVTIVMHVAARIKFDRDLKEAVDINVKGTRRVVQLCRQLPLLKAVVHVSTCYIHLDKPELDEVIYAPPIEPQQLIDAVESMNSAQLHDLIDRLLLTCPNVYACTKAVTEYLLQKEGAGLPLTIVRPSIVTAAFKEPTPGWIDNLNGPTGMIAGVGKGLLRALRYKPDAIGDIIPVDYVTNLVVAAAWYTATYNPAETAIYNCCTGHMNPLTWDQFRRKSFDIGRKYPIKDILWYPSVSVKNNKYLNQMDICLYHYLPAYVIDTVTRIRGQRPRMVRVYDKVHRALSCLDFYMNRQWQFNSNNLVKLIDVMSEEDRQTFDFDVRTIDWQSYMQAYVIGTRQFILKEDLSTLPAGRIQQIKFYWIRFALHIFLLALFYLVFNFLFQYSKEDGELIPTEFPAVIKPLLHIQSPLKR